MMKVSLALALAVSSLLVAAHPTPARRSAEWNYEVDFGLPEEIEQVDRRSAPETTPAGATTGPAPPPPPHFSYQGPSGAARWGSLDAAYALCGSGTHQSPVNLPVAPNGISSDFSLSLANLAAPLSFSNNGHTFQVAVAGNANAAGNRVVYKGKTYQALQFHFHGPSEHNWNGRYYPLEMHLVHKATDGSLLVVGFLLDPYLKPNAFFNNFVGKIPTSVGVVQQNTNLNWRALRNAVAGSAYWQYSGSLTTPPCTEGVQWIVLQQPVGVPPRFVKENNDVSGFNSRFTLPRGDRFPDAPHEE